jgi:hypothetical protein
MLSISLSHLPSYLRLLRFFFRSGLIKSLVFLVFVSADAKQITMAFQYVPFCHDRNYDRPRQAVMPPSHAGLQDDWVAQQSLFMGSSTPLYRQQVSVSPQDASSMSSRYYGAPGTLNNIPDSGSPKSGRSMYPSTTYQYGNPGFYYDSMQFPNCVGSQTAHSHVPQVPYTIPQYNCMPPPPTTPVVLSENISYENGDIMSSQIPPPPYQACTSPQDTSTFVPITSINQVGSSSPILDMNFDESPPLFSTNVGHCEAGCQISSSSTSPVVIKEAKKLTIPTFDPAKISWSSFAMKLHASLIECDLGYLLREPTTNSMNAAHSKELMLALFKKLQGSAINLFTGLSAQRYYLEGGRGIEMIKALVDKFHPMDDRAIQSIISSMQS